MTQPLLYVMFDSKKERDRMAQFCQEQDWSAWHATEQSDVIGPPVLGEDAGLGMARGRKALVFQGQAPQWAWAVMAWMATQSSHRVTVQSYSWPAVFWGEEEIPVWSRPETDLRLHDREMVVVGPDGALRSWRAWDLPKGPDGQEQRRLLAAMSSQWLRYLAQSKRAAKSAKAA